MTDINPTEDYETTLSEHQKAVLDDTPPKVITHLFDYVNENGMPAFFNLRVKSKVDAKETFIEFNGIDAVNAIDYWRYLVRNGYKDLADAG